MNNLIEVNAQLFELVPHKKPFSCDISRHMIKECVVFIDAIAHNIFVCDKIKLCEFSDSVFYFGSKLNANK